MTTALALVEHPSAAAAHAAALTVTAGFDPDPSVVQRAQTPATHHSRARVPLSDLLSEWMRRCADVAPFQRVRELRRSHLLAPPAGGKGAERRAGAVRGAAAEPGDAARVC